MVFGSSEQREGGSIDLGSLLLIFTAVSICQVAN